jgi:hypothetical protein
MGMVADVFPELEEVVGLRSFVVFATGNKENQ